MNTINDKHFLNISNLLPQEKSTLTDKVIQNSKIKRKKTEKELHNVEGINIYPKKGITVDFLLERFKDQGLLFENRKGEVHLTEDGEEKYELCMSDYMSKEFLSYYKEVKELLEKERFPPMKFKILLKFYQQKISMNQLKNSLKLNVHEQKIKKYYETQVGVLTGEEYDENKFYFHFSPELFIKDSNSWELEIEGLPQDNRFVINNPYPNRYYHVLRATPSKETMLGYYPMVGDKSIFEKPLKVKLTWSTTEIVLGKKVKSIIEHFLNIKFSFEKFPDANFFFFNQQIRYGFLDFNEFKPATCLIEKDSLLSKNRTVTTEKINKRHIQLHEDIVLEAVPLGLQMSPHDVSFEKFSKEFFW